MSLACCFSETMSRGSVVEYIWCSSWVMVASYSCGKLAIYVPTCSVQSSCYEGLHLIFPCSLSTVLGPHSFVTSSGGIPFPRRLVLLLCRHCILFKLHHAVARNTSGNSLDVYLST